MVHIIPLPRSSFPPIPSCDISIYCWPYLFNYCLFRVQPIWRVTRICCIIMVANRDPVLSCFIIPMCGQATVPCTGIRPKKSHTNRNNSASAKPRRIMIFLYYYYYYFSWIMKSNQPPYVMFLWAKIILWNDFKTTAFPVDVKWIRTYAPGQFLPDIHVPPT